jgi:hypothetical protein
MHKAKSHRNSKHAKQPAGNAATSTVPATASVVTATAALEPLPEPAESRGKKNKSRR